MPLYEYQCKSCGVTQEIMQKMSDPAPVECPACHSGPLVKLLSRTAFILKGNGWYVTDFRDNKKAAPAADGGDRGVKKEDPSGAKPEAGGGDKASTSSSETKSSDTKSAEPKSSESASKDSAPAKTAAP